MERDTLIGLLEHLISGGYVSTEGKDNLLREALRHLHRTPPAETVKCYDAEFWGADDCTNTKCPHYGKQSCPATGEGGEDDRADKAPTAEQKANPCDNCPSGSYRGCEGCSYGHQTEKGEMMEKYSWSFIEDDDIWRNGADSIEDCIHQAKGETDGEDTVYIGENTAFAPSVDAEHVLDELQEQAGDFAGELGYEWDVYDYKTMRKELDELSDGLTAVVLAWLKKNGREPSFYQVVNVRPYPISNQTEEDTDGKD